MVSQMGSKKASVMGSKHGFCDGFELDGVEPDGFECGMTVLWIRTRCLLGWIRSTAKLLGFELGKVPDGFEVMDSNRARFISLNLNPS